MIKPLVGRKVWYRPSQSDVTPFFTQFIRDVSMLQIDDQPLDATIISVHNDTKVNLMVIDSIGNFFPKLNVILIQEPEDEKPTDGYAEWMPYQVGQAKK